MILMYHKVALEAETIWWVSVDGFYRQMHDLEDKQVVYLDEYDPNNPNHVVITFDGLYTNVIQYAVPILKKFGYSFEVFITSNYLGKNNDFDTTEPYAEFVNEIQLQEVIEAGGRLQWHTKSHQNMKEVTEENQILQELEVPETLKAIDSKSFGWFAYPYGDYNQTVVEYVKKQFKGAISCYQGNDKDLYIFNRITVEDKTSFKDYKISVIIPSYNYGKFLIEAIESVLKQTILPDEILIVDDYSTDSTEDIGKYYAEKYPDLIKFHRNTYNMGIVDNFNNAIKLTSGDFVCFLGADNIFISDYIEKTSKILLQNSNVAIAYTDFALFGERAKIVYDGFLEERKGTIIEDKYYIINFPEFDRELLQKGNYIHGSSMYRRKAYDEVGGYKNKGNSPEDYNLFSRIVLAGWEAKRVPEALLEYRQHSEEQANIKNITAAELEFYKVQNRELFQVVTARDRDIEELRRVVNHRDKDIKELNGEIIHRDKDIVQLNHVIEHRDKDIEALKSVIEHRDKDIEELKSLIDNMKKENASLIEKIDHPIKNIVGKIYNKTKI